MLRIYFLQLWFNLSDPAVEEALYDSVAMRALNRFSHPGIFHPNTNRRIYKFANKVEIGDP